jgi:hypothetical protein
MARRLRKLTKATRAMMEGWWQAGRDQASIHKRGTRNKRVVPGTSEWHQKQASGARNKRVAPETSEWCQEQARCQKRASVTRNEPVAPESSQWHQDTARASSVCECSMCKCGAQSWRGSIVTTWQPPTVCRQRPGCRPVAG